MELTATQTTAVQSQTNAFLLGASGSGKTTALQQRVLHLLESGEPAYTILVLVAEPEHKQAYVNAVHQSGLGPYADLNITSYNSMAMNMVNLFWPLVARPVGFTQPYRPPTVLTYDLAQLLMWRVVTPMLDEGAFADLRLRPQQIVSQLLDTLNRAALNSLDLEDALLRQQTTWAGEPERQRHFLDTAVAARTFRRTCLENSLLDLALVIEAFDTQLVQHPVFHNYFRERYRHLIVDNVEEQTPAGQNFIAQLMDEAQTTAIAYDSGGGYKRFMAADPTGARQFHHRCQQYLKFDESFRIPPDMLQIANLVENFLEHTHKPTALADDRILEVVNGRYRREMVFNLVAELRRLVEGGTAPKDIAIITPYLDGALRYMLGQALELAGLPYRLLRRRSSPREEPRIRAWLTWLALAHPEWGYAPTAYDVAEALTLSIRDLDAARAELITRHLYRPENIDFLPIDTLPDKLFPRIGADFLALVERLRNWLFEESDRTGEQIDVFLHALFTQVLAQPEFQPTPDIAGAAVCDWLMQAAERLQQAAPAMGLHTPAEVGIGFIDGIYQGLVTANPPDLGEPPDPNGITISTIYGYLLAGEPVAVQVWLETAATGWWDIPRQPLSNAFVLAQSYDPQQLWTADQDLQIRHELLSRIVRGLVNRCSGGIILANSDLDRRGIRQDGPLWRALQPAL